MVSELNSPINVLVTAVGGGSQGNEVLKALRIAENRYRLVGVDMNPRSLGLYQTDASYIVPPARHPEYLAVVLELCRKEDVRVLIAGSDPELKVISDNRKRFADADILTLINDPGVIELCMDKWSTMRFLSENGFNVPRSVLLEREDDCAKVQKLPVVIKPAVGGGGSNLVFIAQDHEELSFFVRYILKAGALPLAQEYLGTPEEEYTVGVLRTLEGALVASLAVRRDILSGLSNKMKVQGRTGGYIGHTLAISSGISQGMIDNFPVIREECERLAGIIGSKGPLNVQLRVVDGKIYIFEINPRFSGTTAFRALAGFNEPDIMIRHHLLGETIGRISYKDGVVVRGLVERFIRPHEILQQSWLSPRTDHD